MSLGEVLARGRATARALMVDTVRVWRPGDQVLDRMTGRLVAGPPLVLYEGPGRIKPESAQGREVTAGEREVVLRRYVVSLPWDTVPADMPRPGDRVTAVASADARLAGRDLVVMGVQYSATATAWRITGEDAA